MDAATADVSDWSLPPPGVAPALCQPSDATQALALGGQAGAAWIAGGTALQLAWGVAEEERPTVTLLIDLLAGAVPAGVLPDQLPDGRPALRIGAGTRLEALRRCPELRTQAPRLAEALDAIAAPGVRHLATLGGNVGWRCGDALPVLLARGAWAALADGSRRPLAELLHMRTGQPLPLISALLWPLDTARWIGWSVVEKVGWRAAFSPSRLTLALEVACDDGAFATPSLAATAAGWPARRLPAVEAWLAGRRPEALIREAAGLRAACAADLRDAGPPQAERTRLAARLISGHLSREASVHGG